MRFVATDLAGNVAAPVVLTFTLDRSAPFVALDSPFDGLTIDVTTLLAGTAFAGASLIVSLTYAFDGGTAHPILFDPLTGAFSQAMDLHALSAGAHTLTVTATNAAGNSTVVTRDVTLMQLVPPTASTSTFASRNRRNPACACWS